MITVVYLAKLADLVGRTSEAVNTEVTDSNALIALLTQRGEPWCSALTHNLYKLAINNQIVHGNTPLHDGDTVALLPPVTGG